VRRLVPNPEPLNAEDPDPIRGRLPGTRTSAVKYQGETLRAQITPKLARQGGESAASEPITSTVQRLAVVRPGRLDASSLSRPAQRSLALRPAHSRCHRISCHANRRLQPFRFLHSCSGCFRLEPLPGGILTRCKAPLSHGAHPKQRFASRHLDTNHRPEYRQAIRTPDRSLSGTSSACGRGSQRVLPILEATM
jgi:hypothetical protein